MKLYLLRHAERGHGKEQDSLTLYGKEQSENIVPHLKSLNIDKIFCAKTNRAEETIKPFMKHFSKEIEYTSLINEQEMGELNGKSGEDYRKVIEKSGLNKKEFRPEKGENYYDLFERAKKFLDSLKKEKAERILISTHAGFIRATVALLLNLPEEKLEFNSASITFIELDKHFKVISYNINKDISN
jgi:broad specificity phosphatase PhoE